jgi:hypothetical protein
MSQGFVILAENTEKINYVACAEVLARSIKKVMPKSSIALISNDVSMCSAFDYVVELPYGDLDPKGDWKLINDWQVYEASPYEYTIKLEADMFIPQSIDYWWDVLKQREIVICTNIRNYKQELSNIRHYRKFIDDNKLPDTYNAMTYFKKSQTADQFYKQIRTIFENWEEYRSILKCNLDELATTDWVYAIASHNLGIENTTLPLFNQFSFTHMKQHINNCTTEDWTECFVYECLPHCVRIQTVPQLYPLHYHVKSFCHKLEDAL